MPTTPEQMREFYQRPFSPAPNISVEMRAANALEYIAAAMGRISERLESIDRALSSPPRPHFPTTGEPPFYER